MIQIIIAEIGFQFGFVLVYPLRSLLAAASAGNRDEKLETRLDLDCRCRRRD